MVSDQVLYITLISATVGAIATLGREIIAGVFGLRQRGEERKKGQQIELWSELRSELNDLRKELDEVRSELDLWKGKYWALMDEHLSLKSQHMSLDKELGELRTVVQRNAEDRP